jgi:hypothetical protein
MVRQLRQVEDAGEVALASRADVGEPQDPAEIHQGGAGAHPQHAEQPGPLEQRGMHEQRREQGGGVDIVGVKDQDRRRDEPPLRGPPVFPHACVGVQTH